MDLPKIVPFCAWPIQGTLLGSASQCYAVLCIVLVLHGQTVHDCMTISGRTEGQGYRKGQHGDSEQVCWLS